jgi:hypothetical protein
MARRALLSPSTRPFVVALAVALGLHGLLSLGALLPPRRFPVGPPLPPPLVYYDIDELLLREPPPPPPEASAPVTPSPLPTGGRPAASRPAATARPGLPAPRVAPEEAPSPSPAAPAPKEAPTPGATPPTPAADEYGSLGEEAESEGLPGLGGRPVYAISPGLVGGEAGFGTTEPAPAPKAPKPVDEQIASRVLTGTLRTRDAELGLALPAAGRVQASVVSAVQASDAPAESRGTLQITLRPDGTVAAVRATQFSAGNEASWGRVAAAVQAELARTVLPMGSADERGAIVTVTVESKVLYPAGTKEKAELRPVCVDEVARAAIDPTGELTQGDPKNELPCIPIGLALKGDLANLGTKPQRRLSTKVRVEVPGEKALVDPKLVDTRVPWLAPREGEIRRSDVVKRKKKKKKK